MTDTGRPAQTGQYRSIQPSEDHSMEHLAGALFTIEQPSNHSFGSL